METKQIEVDCPCCAARLTIDVLTRTVIRSTAAREANEMGQVEADEGRWESAAARVRSRPDRAQDELAQALERERDKEDRLDDLFDKARRKLEQRGESEST